MNETLSEEKRCDLQRAGTVRMEQAVAESSRMPRAEKRPT